LLDLRGAVQQFTAERNAQELCIRYVSGRRNKTLLSFHRLPNASQPNPWQTDDNGRFLKEDDL
jgi:hypothetical protein